MKFKVDSKVFEMLPNACFGVVVAKGVDNSKSYPEIDAFLDESINKAYSYFEGKKVKEEKEIIPYREAFQKLGINPNKYMCSIEALFTRIAKGKGMPHINPLVDLNNAISLKHTIPMGTLDLSLSNEDMEVRLSKPGDTFIPFGSTEIETPEENEVVYAVGSEVRTRRWVWRHSERGKIDETTSYVFFPLDGFTDFNKDEVLAARDELAEKLQTIFGCEVKIGYVDKDNPEMDLD